MPHYALKRGLDGPQSRSGLYEGVALTLTEIRTPDRAARSLVTIVTELPRLWIYIVCVWRGGHERFYRCVLLRLFSIPAGLFCACFVFCNTIKCPPTAVGKKQLLGSSDPADGLPHRPQQFLDIDRAGCCWNQYTQCSVQLENTCAAEVAVARA